MKDESKAFSSLHPLSLKRFCAIGLLSVMLLVWPMASPAFAGPDTSVSVPLKVLRTGHITVSVRVNGKGPIRLVLDTGSPVTFLSHAAARRCGVLGPKAGPQTGVMGLELGGFATVKALEIGGARVRNLDILILDHPIIQMLSAIEGPVDGIVGFSFFAHFRTTIDYSAARISFARVAYDPPDVMKNILRLLMNRDSTKRIVAPAAMWGMAVDKTDEAEGVLVREVLAQGPAEAGGLRAGDRITSLDGRWTESVLDLYEAAARVRPGQAVPVQLLRDGMRLEITIRPCAGV